MSSSRNIRRIRAAQEATEAKPKLQVDVPEYDYCDTGWTPLFSTLAAMAVVGFLFLIAVGLAVAF